jgi:hypothetical protein
MKTVPSRKVVLGMLVLGICLGFLLNLAYHEPGSWHGFVFGVLGGLFGVFLYSRLNPPDAP